MSNEKTGGPAHPVTKDNGFGYEYTIPGNLTILDHFAGLAMQGMLADPSQYGTEAKQNPDKCAAWAYQQAQCMIAERKRLMEQP